MDHFFKTITWLGSLYVLLPLCMLLGLLLWWRGRVHDAALLGLSLLATSVTVHVAKQMIRRPRPQALGTLVAMPSDWSFPSAHSAQVTAFLLALSLVSWRVLPKSWAGMVAGVSLLLAAAVCVSRVVLQVHYRSDVLVGAALAIVMVLAIRAALPWLKRGP
jgi:undecaprenyl-diphosphatase